MEIEIIIDVCDCDGDEHELIVKSDSVCVCSDCDKEQPLYN